MELKFGREDFFPIGERGGMSGLMKFLLEKEELLLSHDSPNIQNALLGKFCKMSVYSTDC